ncbi:MAG: YbhB/YbcL family Raf kinase inhibitor-like protein [Myxococcota bacterium]|nr:YbhB/YbcL family Raf kinase inhibitor-like protein [Myxococcota bacterium]
MSSRGSIDSLVAFTALVAIGCGGGGKDAACPTVPTAAASASSGSGADSGAPLAQPSIVSGSPGNELLDPNPAPATIVVKLTTDGGRVPLQSVFNGFGCTGKNVSLGISWSGAPASTQSYAVILHDPDAPTGVGFFHWSVFNLPKGTTSLAPGASTGGLPAGAGQGYTDFGVSGYGGPCPPPGAPHRYIATVYALDVPKLDVGPGATGALLRFMLAQHTTALGRATATYGR